MFQKGKFCWGVFSLRPEGLKIEKCRSIEHPSSDVSAPAMHDPNVLIGNSLGGEAAAFRSDGISGKTREVIGTLIAIGREAFWIEGN